MARPDAIVFCISQQYLSAGRQAALAEGLLAASPVPARLVRLEGTGPHLGMVLDELADEGHGRILVQLLGLPFSQSLAAWIPGVLAHWKAERGDGVELLLGDDDLIDADMLGRMAQAAVDRTDGAVAITDQKPSLGKPGWNKAPPFKHHLLVCTGPRCHFRGAPNLKIALTEALTAAGLSKECLVATTGCLYPCNQGPLLAAYPRGEWYRLLDREAVERFVTTVIGAGEALPDLIVQHVAPLEAPSLSSGEPP